MYSVLIVLSIWKQIRLLLLKNGYANLFAFNIIVSCSCMFVQTTCFTNMEYLNPRNLFFVVNFVRFTLITVYYLVFSILMQ